MTQETIASHLRSALDEVNLRLSLHDDIRLNDNQYEDPEEWWLRHVKKQIEAALAATEGFGDDQNRLAATLIAGRQ